MRTLINFNVDNLTDNDLLIFYQNEWVSIKKDIYLKGVYDRINTLQEQNKALEKQIVKLQNNLAEIAEIVKGVIQ